jgi:hypothetical protein
MPLILSGSVDISGSMTATTILVSAPGAGGMVSSSAQIQNYNLFAVTSSANTFYGTQTISGDITSQLSNTDVTFGDVPNAQLINTATATTNQYAGIRYRFQDGSLNGNSFIGALRNSSTSRAHSIIIAPSDAGGGNPTQAIKINTTTTEITGSVEITNSIRATYANISQAGSATAITQNARFTNSTTSTANGSGVGFDFALTDSTGAGKQTGQIASVWSDYTTNAAANLEFYTRPSGAGIAKVLTLASTGAATFTNTVTANTGFKLPANGNGTSPTIAYNNSLGFGINGTGLFFGNLYNSDLTTAMQLRVTNSGGTDVTAMTILSSGNVGIATTTPGYKLDVNGDFKSGTSYLGQTTFFRTDVVGAQNYGGSTIRVAGGTGASAAGIQFGDVSSNDTGARGRIGFLASANNGNPKEFAIIKGVLDSTGANTCNGSLTFHTLNGDNASEAAVRMTIDGSGNIGAASGTNIYNASDARLKQNISSISGSLNSVLALNPVKFNWVDDFVPSENGKDMLGFLAQEIQTIVPEAVESFGADSIFVGETEIDNPLRVNEKFLIPVLTKAIQEQQAIIDGLIARIEALENN